MASTSVWYGQILTVRKIRLTGDFNARTGTLPDYVENDLANYRPLPDQYQVDQLLSRYSKDQVTIENEKELVDLCISANLHIITGWLYYDAQIGNFTCCLYWGNSACSWLCSAESWTQSFSVQSHTIFSDHCALTFSLGRFLKPLV